MLTYKITLVPSVCPGNMNGTFAFDVTNNLQYSIFWRNLDKHVNMVSHQVTFMFASFFLYRKLPENITKMSSEMTI